MNIFFIFSDFIAAVNPKGEHHVNVAFVALKQIIWNDKFYLFF